MSLFQDIKNTLRTDGNSTGLPRMAIKNGEFQQISSYKKQKLKNFQRTAPSVSIWHMGLLYLGTWEWLRFSAFISSAPHRHPDGPQVYPSQDQ